MLTAAFLAIIAAASCAFAAAESYPADEIEAAFLYRFAGFVSWPPQALNPATFTIAVLDDTAVAADLDRMLSHGELKSRRVQIRNITSIGAVGDAQILYIRAGEASMLKSRLAALARHHVLVVTSEPGGLADGSTINFLLLERHVRFEISLVAARRAGLSISADLLSVATHIEGHPVGSEAPCGILPVPLRPAPLCLPHLAAR
jgi:hypothetical protein